MVPDIPNNPPKIPATIPRNEMYNSCIYCFIYYMLKNMKLYFWALYKTYAKNNPKKFLANKSSTLYIEFFIL